MLQGRFTDLHNKWATLHALVAIPAGQGLLQTPPNSADLDQVAPRVNRFQLWLTQDAQGLWLEPDASDETRPSRAVISSPWFVSGRWLRLERDGHVLRTWPLAGLRSPTLLVAHNDVTSAVQVTFVDGAKTFSAGSPSPRQSVQEILAVKRLPAIDNLAQSLEAPLSTVQTPWGTAQLAIDSNNTKAPWRLSERGIFAPEKVSFWVDDKAVGMTIKLDIGEDLRLRYIPPGTFLMGSPDGVGVDDEHPQHPVTITQGYWLAETPCTQALWHAVMGSNSSHFAKGPDAPRLPVESVSHKDVRTFLQKLQSLLPAGVEVGLPTEAEWEYACRAGTHTTYWWGNDFDPAMANTEDKNDKTFDDYEGTSPVGHYPANPWGLYDMHGNVWEWCEDSRRSYRAEAVVNPIGSVYENGRVIRGGTWCADPSRASSATRGGRYDHDLAPYVGFRLLLRPSSSGSAKG
jgi:formylglycine-generating enzyme required for sulfatase activity